MFKHVPRLFLGKKWTKRFFISHMAGWLLANLQTFWIVYEIRRAITDTKG